MTTLCPQQLMKNLLSLSRSDVPPSLDFFFEVLEATGADRLDELAEVTIDFCQNHGILINFVRSIISKHIWETDEMVLFREDSFAIKLINRILFGDLGRKYLTKLVAPLIKKIQGIEMELDIRKDSETNPEVLKENVQTTVILLEEFLTLFASSPQFCPVSFREIFGTIQSCVEERFGQKSESSPPFVLDFIFFKFICPSLINPARYQLVEEEDLNPINRKNLLNISKVLNLLAHNVYEKFEGEDYSKLISFIQTKHCFLVHHLEKLLDLKEIERCKTIIASSYDVSVCIEEMNRSREQFSQFIMSITNPEEHYLLKKNKSNSKQSVSKFSDLVNCCEDALWKFIKSKEGAYLYSLKDKETNLMKHKLVFTLERGMDQIFEHIISSEIWKPKSNDVFETETIYDGETYKEYRALWRLPFPISNRDLICSQWEYRSQKEAAVIIDDTASQMPRNKGFIRGKTFTSGLLLQSLSENSTKLSLLWHVDPKGSIPKWMLNQMGSILLSRWAKMKHDLEFSCK